MKFRENRGRARVNSRDFRRLRLKLVLRGREGFFFAQNLQKNRNALKKKRRSSRAREKRPAVKRALSSATLTPFPPLLEKRERENPRKERDGTYHGDRSNFLSLRVRGRGKEKSEREKRKKQKKLDLRKRVKKSKNNTKKRTDGIHVEKKKGEQMKKGIEFPHFSNTLKLSRFTHTHTTKKTL